MANKVAAYYARVSTNRQEMEATIDSQIAEVVARIKEDGNILDDNLKFADDGWSGDLLARPALDRMRDAAAKKEFDVLYIWDRDRIGRKFYIQELILEELDELGIELIDLHGTKAESPEDKILMGFKGLFAEFEKAKIGERMRRGKMFKAKQGLYMNLSAPYGYTYIPKTKDSPGYLVVNEEEAKIVRQIYVWMADDGLTIKGVIKKLYELKIYPRKRKTEFWTQGPVGRLIRNESYIGKGFYNKSFSKVPDNPQVIEKYRRIKKTSRGRKPKEDWIPQVVPPILDEELFYKVQAQLQHHLNYNKRNIKAPYLLTGKVYCICGNRRNGEGVREHKYYRCSDRIHCYPLPPICKASGVNAFHLDSYVWKKVVELMTDPELIYKHAKRWMAKQSKVKTLSEIEVQNSVKILKKLEEEEKRYLKAYGAGVLTLTQFKDKVQEIKERKEVAQLDIDKAAAQKQNPPFDLTSIKNLDNKVMKVLNEVNLDEQRVFLQGVLHSVVVGNANKVQVKGYIPARKEAQNVKFQPIYRDSLNTVRHDYEKTDQILPFEIHITLPESRKTPIIVNRDELGRIIQTEFPSAKYP